MGLFRRPRSAAAARASANYGVDPDIVNHEDYKDTIKDEFRAVPTISLVVDPDDLWDLDTGIYMNSMSKGDRWERPISMEWINGDGSTEFQADAGVRIHGGWARRISQTKKFSFRINFKSEYGEPLLDHPVFGDDGQQVFQSLILRGGFNDSWRSSSNSDNTYMQDQWSRLAQRDLGGYSSRETYVHLYLNGLYWGMYSPTERMNAEWAAANMGGEPEEWDVINTGGNVVDGNSRAWSDLMRATRGDVDYEQVKSMLDVDGFIDYLIVNQYIGNWDWPHNNWYASRRNVEGEKWRFHTWDAEAAFQRGIGENRVASVNDAVGPSQVYLALRGIPEFQRQFADHVQKHLFNGGQLTEQAAIDRLASIAARAEHAIVGESARWGDGKDDQGRPITQASWLRRIDTLNRTYFPRRGERLIAQYQSADLYPETPAPDFNQFGGLVSSEFDIELTTTLPDGTIYYTTDNSDPRGPNDEVTNTAIRLNTVDLTNADSEARVLVPTGAASEANWQNNDFNDASWVSGKAAVGFDTGVVDDLISVPDGFRVRDIKSSVRLNSLADVDLLLNGENVVRTETVLGVPYIDYRGGTRGGHFDDTTIDFPQGGNDFAVDVTGKLEVKEAGTYTLGVTVNDGVRIIVDGEVLFADPDRHSTQDRFVTVDLSEGLHDVRLVMFDRSGTAVLEFFYALGAKTEFDDDFLLVGDLKNRPYDDLIATDVREQMLATNASAYVRVPFEVSDLDNIGGIYLQPQYDDGFVAYLNGAQIAARRAPEVVTHDSSATSPNVDANAIEKELIDVTEFKELLRDGQNVLAFHALNASANDADFLLIPTMFAVLGDTPINLAQSTSIKARVLSDGNWSALADAPFTVGEAGNATSLRISEIHFHPSSPSSSESNAGHDDRDDFEYIELVNVGETTVSLADVNFVQQVDGESTTGIEFDFSTSDIKELGPGERVIVAEDIEAFTFRYGTEIAVAGQWTGGLGNAGEMITLRSGADTIHQFEYANDWHLAADGGGSSLEIFRPENVALDQWSNASSWRASVPGGTPGISGDFTPGDSNRDGIFDSSDLVLIFGAGEFEDGVVGNSTWEEGDWNGDGEFDSRDLVLAFQIDNYSESVAAVPTKIEPISVDRTLERDRDLDDVAQKRHAEKSDSLEQLDSAFEAW